ncbi:cupin domain-containing protein [Celeribacter persicus]|uniref:Putative cupin superfamily protein n=1 Tax=Celeribacter persicus TaxID=1651082 RepID=A0A2T5HM01_9RHOB|nr:cupin domain-containing protein [Celeribacter persicus]PTQ72600.1 putative cupin superfamily protein [Celeribacter persicus]
MPKFTPQTVRTDSGHSAACGPYEALLFSDSGELTQFGAFLEILPPGSASALKHWHEGEDEMVYMIAGEVIVTEGDETYPLSAGEAATFKAGVARGHCLRNNGPDEARYLKPFAINLRYELIAKGPPHQNVTPRFPKICDSGLSRNALVIGTRSAGDTVTYPDHDRILRFTRSGANITTRTHTTTNGIPSGSPYED